jgi:Ran GTPase-activating protein (RanGAP) involved in mRNA processing and transport
MSPPAAEDWALSDAQRAETVARVRANISSLAFFRGAPIGEAAAAAAAAAAERRAYTTARVEARTTTGSRPHHETLKAYVRKLSELALEAVVACAADGAAEGADGAADGAAADLLDISAGAREFLTAEHARELLAPMLAPGAAVQRIRFSTKSFGAEAAEVAAAAIRNCAATLTHADLSDVIAGRPEDEALAALRVLAAALASARLEHLDLSDNALGEKGLRAAAAAFVGQPALASLEVRNVGCSVHGCAALDELLAGAALPLRRLVLVNNMSGDEGAVSIARVLARCPALEEFRMVSSRVGAEGGRALVAALAGLRGGALRALDLHDNPLTEEVAEEVAPLLAAHPQIRALVLTDTCLGDAGVAAVAAALRGGAAPALERLELALNEVAPAGAAALAAALAGRPALRALVLRENELECAGAVALAAALRTLPALEALDLSANQLRRRGALAVARAVAALPALASLELDDNEISDAGVDALREVLLRACKLAALGSLDENCPDSEGEEDEADEEEEEGADEEGAERPDAAVDALAAELAAEHL